MAQAWEWEKVHLEEQNELGRVCCKQKPMELAEAKAERRSLSCKSPVTWGKCVNKYILFLLSLDNHDEFKTNWLAELMFKHSLSGWFNGSFWGCLRAITMCTATSKWKKKKRNLMVHFVTWTGIHFFQFQWSRLVSANIVPAGGETPANLRPQGGAPEALAMGTN